MAGAIIDAEVIGLKETQAEMERIAAELHGAPVVQAIRDSTLLVQRDAKIAAPVDTGRLRASIMPEIRTPGNDVEGVVGSNVFYAPFMEYGTRPHWPPQSALETWARRHGTSAFVVARAIARRGTKARLFLTNAFESNKDKIIHHINNAVRGIIK